MQCEDLSRQVGSPPTFIYHPGEEIWRFFLEIMFDLSIVIQKTPGALAQN
jgi:hypothetical protein